VAFVLVAAAALTSACGGRDTRVPSADAAVGGDSSAGDAASTVDAEPVDSAVDAARVDSSGGDAACTTADSRGFFSSCEPCAPFGGDCDTIDVAGSTRYACGCSGGCPCGLSCGSYEIAPGVTVDGICVR